MKKKTSAATKVAEAKAKTKAAEGTSEDTGDIDMAKGAKKIKGVLGKLKKAYRGESTTTEEVIAEEIENEPVNAKDAKADLEAKKTDIERRRQKELSTFDPMKDSTFSKLVAKETSLRSSYALTPGQRLKDELEAAEKATIQRGEELGAEINAKYDAELAAEEKIPSALKNVSTAGLTSPKNKKTSKYAGLVKTTKIVC